MGILKSLGNKAFCFILKRKGAKVLRHLDVLSKKAAVTSEKLLMTMVFENADTEFGRKYGFSEIKNSDDYRKAVPLSDYSSYEPFIKRMIENGEEGLLTNYPIKHYALTSGSTGNPKYIPVSGNGVKLSADYSTILCIGVMNEYYKNTTGKPYKSGFCLNTIESPVNKNSFGVPQGTISGTVLNPYRKLLKYFMTSPDEVLFPTEDMNMKYLKLIYALREKNVVCIVSPFMTAAVDLFTYLEANWELLCNDIENGTLNKDIQVSDKLRKKLEAKLNADQKRAEFLRKEFKAGFNGIIPRIWRNFQWVGSIGTASFSQYAVKMRFYTGKNIPFNYLEYGASEAMMAVERRTAESSYVLAPDCGYFEFIPVDNENTDNVSDNPKTLTLSELEQGKDYEIVITNLSGFYRYRLNDVVRVTGFYNECPMLSFMYRKNQLISIAGEKTNEGALNWSIARFVEETGVSVNDYSIYADTESKPGRYVVFIEPDTEIPEDKLYEFRDKIERNLSFANPSLGQKININALGHIKLCSVEKETYMLYRDLQIVKGVSPNQIKPVRVIDSAEKTKFFFGLTEKETD